MNTIFAPKYILTNSGKLVNAMFNRKYCFIPPKMTQEGKSFMLILDRESIEINNTPQKKPTSMYAIEKYIDGYLTREVRNTESS